MDDVIRHGFQPVPKHLRSATGRQRHDTGDGAGYLYPHDFEEADVDQQYLPDFLHGQGRRYYLPSDQGVERRIGDFMEGRRTRRAAGRPKRVPQPGGNPMTGMGDGMKAHTEARKKLADTQKRDAGS